MLVHYENKLVYMGIPRTGTRSTEDVLLSLGFVPVGNRHSSLVPTRDDRWPVNEGVEGLHSAMGGRHAVTHGLLKSWTTFCMVRNHFDRMASLWRMTHGTRMPNLENDDDTEYMLRLIRDHTRLKQACGNPPGFMYFPWTAYANVVLHFESFEEDLQEFLFREHGFSETEIPHVGGIATSNYSHREYFNVTTALALERACGREMRRYGYQW